ncbi:hypothetical protein TWF225_002973 [Orbilia oligospora]|nr:hypothetical protein TWF751_002686 [Orbilia oligospora]KAF3189215.1 hypothetical protein TWF225_002973 [Orbilia oligospora]KAF3267929.1 hypothetical protein TWF217_011651 [Orbilia oligospora]KAF3269658.1 hypothetical protein TWF128_005849 [Orbilia oligospora]
MSPNCAYCSATFNKNYAILNLDWMTILIDAVKDTPEGQTYIANCSRWNDAVHEKTPRPITIFTTLFFSNKSQPELHKSDKAPFAKQINGYSLFESGSPEVQIDPRFLVDENDIVLQKTRWYAGAGNALEQILRARDVDTVIISGLSMSGAVMSTMYHLIDLDYKIYLISENLLELPATDTAKYLNFLLGNLLSKMHVEVISLEEALRALDES